MKQEAFVCLSSTSFHPGTVRFGSVDKRAVCRRRRFPSSMLEQPPSSSRGRLDSPDGTSTDKSVALDQKPAKADTQVPIESTVLEQVSRDLSNLTNFLESFVNRAKTPLPENENNGRTNTGFEPFFNEGDDSGENQQTAEKQYAPRSATGTRIATDFALTRGIIERTIEKLSIQTSNMMDSFVGTVGIAIVKVLDAGHSAFPGLRLDETSRSIGDAMKGNWSMLSAFQWQLGAAEDQDTRRKAYVSELSKFIDENGRSSVIGNFVIMLGNMGRVVEKLSTPTMKFMMGISKESTKRVLPVSPNIGGDDVVVTITSFRSAYTSSKSPAQRPISKAALETSGAAKSDVRRSVKKSKNTRRYTHSGTEVNRDTPRRKSKRSVPRPCQPLQSPNETKNEESLTNSNLVKGALVLAAGAAATVAASANIPLLVSCSTLAVTSLAIANSQKLLPVETYKRLQKPQPQSESLKQMEKLYKRLKGSLFEQRIHKSNQSGLVQKINETDKDKDQTPSTLSTSNEVDLSISGTDNIFETSSYSVSGSEPQILTVPIVGLLLKLFDNVAFRIEEKGALFFKRLGVWNYIDDSDQWILLESFERRKLR